MFDIYKEWFRAKKNLHRSESRTGSDCAVNGVSFFSSFTAASESFRLLNQGILYAFCKRMASFCLMQAYKSKSKGKGKVDLTFTSVIILELKPSVKCII